MIIIYTLPNCPKCDIAKNHCISNDIDYFEVEIHKDISVEMLTKIIGHRPKTAPIITKDGEVLSLEKFINDG